MHLKLVQYLRGLLENTDPAYSVVSWAVVTLLHASNACFQVVEKVSKARLSCGQGQAGGLVRELV